MRTCKEMILYLACLLLICAEVKGKDCNLGEPQLKKIDWDQFKGKWHIYGITNKDIALGDKCWIDEYVKNPDGSMKIISTYTSTNKGKHVNISGPVKVLKGSTVQIDYEKGNSPDAEEAFTTVFTFLAAGKGYTLIGTCGTEEYGEFYYIQYRKGSALSDEIKKELKPVLQKYKLKLEDFHLNCPK